MSKCPHCQQPIKPQVIRCPYCNNPLKAYGHPGIPLHQAIKGEFLCDSCLYHEDDTCTFPQRPYAKNCTLYHDKTKPLIDQSVKMIYPANPIKALQIWCSRHRRLLLLLGLIAIALIMTLG